MSWADFERAGVLVVLEMGALGLAEADVLKAGENVLGAECDIANYAPCIFYERLEGWL